MRRKDFSPQEIQEIIELYLEEEMGAPSIGLKLNASKSVITRILKNNGVEMRPAVKPRYKGVLRLAASA